MRSKLGSNITEVVVALNTIEIVSAITPASTVDLQPGDGITGIITSTKVSLDK